jgi:DNA repair protein RecO (recombination protein O)
VEVFETSAVATLFTRSLGKVVGLAKGGRRLKSPFQGGLDLLGHSDIVLLHKASEAMDLLTEAAPIERFTSLRQDLAALYAGYHIAELLTELTDFHDPHPKLFDAAVVTLRHLGEPILRDRRVFRFELACLRELGHMPVLDACSHCGEAVESPMEAESIAFGLATTGVIGKLAGATLDALRRLSSPGSSWRSLDPSPASMGPVRATLGAVISHLLGRRPRMLPYLGLGRDRGSGPGPGLGGETENG